MFGLLRFAVISSILFVGATSAAEPFGPVGTLGPAGAVMRTCSGLSQCYICTPSSCAPSGSWQTRIERAVPGETILLRAGTYRPSGTLDIPTGTASNLITVANFNGEAAQVAGPVAFGSGHARMEGLTVNAPSSSYAVLIQSMNSSLKSNIELKNMDVMGGTIEAIRIRGNVSHITIRNSLLDGGRNNHVVKVLCDSESSSGCRFTPEEISITNNKFSKVRTSFFPKSHCCDEADGGSGDLLQTEGAGNITITHNAFGQSDYENCVDIKRQGRPGTVFVLSYNIMDGRHTGQFPTTGPGCRFGGLLMTQSNPSGTMTVEGNLIMGRGNLIRGTSIGAVVQNNIFDGAEFTIASPNSRLVLGYNTFMNAENRMTFGDSTGRPVDLTVINNIFSQTRFMGTRGSYNPIGNLLFQTSGSTLGSCPSCVTGNPRLDGYELQEGSAALGAANTAFTVPRDINGTSRPQDDSFDIGAHEFVGEEPPTQNAFDANVIPGRIEAEYYDLGDEGVTYHDLTIGNSGGAYRDDNVDIKSNAYDSGFSIGWMQPGEWLEYTIDVAEAGEYRLRANVGTIQSNGPSFTVSIDGTPVATVVVPNTGSWDVKQLVEVADVTLDAGEHLLRINVNQQWLDVDYLDFVLPDDPAPLAQDTVSPQVEILQPADGATASRWATRSIRISAGDGGSGVDSVILRIEGSVAAQFFGNGEHTYAWRPRGRSNRQAVIEVVATDFAGHTVTDSVTVRVTR